MYPQQNAARFFTIPQIPNSDSADEITNLNNSIVMAADSGATVIVVPNLDPNLVSTATAYAEERGIPVYMVPREPFYGRRSPSSAYRVLRESRLPLHRACVPVIWSNP